MGRTLNRLTAADVKSITEPGYYADGGGLYLRVAPGGSKGWIFRFEMHGRRRDCGLGSYPDISLANARENTSARKENDGEKWCESGALDARECRELISRNRDPIEYRKERLAAAATEAAKTTTFGRCAADYIALHEPEWRNAKHREQWSSTVKTYVSPFMGHVPVQQVDTGLVLKVLAPLWAAKKVDTGKRVRGRIEMILDWAKAMKYRTGENPALWRGNLEHLLLTPSKVRSVRHQPALPYPELPAFIKELRAIDGISARALEFTILCAARTSAVIGATWAEFDLVAKMWTVQPERDGAKITGKNPAPRRVALSDQAVAILGALPTDETYVFTNRRTGAAISDMAMLEVLRGLRPGYTVHGFRSTFKDWASETTAFPNEVSEAALWHVVEDKTEAAYRRGDLLDKRRQLMKAWAGYCERDIVKGTNVVPLARHAWSG